MPRPCLHERTCFTAPIAISEVRLTDELNRLAAAAGVAVPTLEVQIETKRLARVRHGRDGVRIIVRPETLLLPPEVLSGILAHEVAHIARNHASIRSRMAIASVGAIWAIVLAATMAMVVLLRTGLSWLWPAPAAAAICLLVLTRAIPLALMRRQEYEADRVAATLVGGPDEVVAFLDWVSSHGGDRRSKPWYATHPSNVARRQALLGAQSSRL